MAKQLDRTWIGAVVSEGTMRDVDLFDSFIDVLREVDEARALALEDRWGLAEEDPQEDTMSEIVHELFGALEEIAPDGCYFGASEGDGACYGFWTMEEEG